MFGASASDLAVELDVVPQVILPTTFQPEALQALVVSVLRNEGKRGDWNVAVVFTDDQTLRSLHSEFMGIDSETDVMTFPSDEAFHASVSGGDIVISVDRAAENAVTMGHSTWEESRFLVVHGLLHLCGWSDETDEDRAKMLGRQRELLDAFDRGGSAPGPKRSP